MAESSLVTVVCALPSEAAPLIDGWRLRCSRDRPFKLFEGSGIRLIISGIGSHASAAAVGFAAGLATPTAADIWLNVGIAGHRDLPLGSPVLAHKIGHDARPQAWYPSLLFDPPCQSATVVTFDSAVTTYPDGLCCDMEAAGFMAAVTAIAGGDLVQVLKIVSDNAKSGLEHIDRAFIQGLLAAHVDLVAALLDRLREVAQAMPAILPDSDLEALLSRWRFSGAEIAQLRQLRRRHAALAGRTAWYGLDLTACHDGREALALIRARVDALPLIAAPAA